MKAIVHVHQAQAKKKDPANHPAIIVRTYKGSTHHRHIKMNGPVNLFHSATPDSCGATIWMELDHSQIELID